MGLERHLRVAGQIGPQGLIPSIDRYGTALADLVRCPRCGHMQLDAMPDQERRRYQDLERQLATVTRASKRQALPVFWTVENDPKKELEKTYELISGDTLNNNGFQFLRIVWGKVKEDRILVDVGVVEDALGLIEAWRGSQAGSAASRDPAA